MVAASLFVLLSYDASRPLFCSLERNMYEHMRQIWALVLFAHIVCGTVRVELNDGRIVTVKDKRSIKPTVNSEHGDSIVGGLTARDLFGRQSCSAPGMNVICGSGCCTNGKYCCEQTTCIDLTAWICCPGGRQCLKGGECCNDGSCVSYILPAGP